MFSGHQVGDVGVNCDAGVEARDVSARGFGLRQALAGVGLVEEHLALQVGRLDEVAVDQGKGADAGAREQARRRPRPVAPQPTIAT